MRRNVERNGGAIFSERVLLSLVNKGLSRDAAYRIVQAHAHKVSKDGGDLKQELLNDPQTRRYLSASEIEKIWDLEPYLKSVDHIFRRVFH
jgi:adenylosuccinate lyase